MKKQYFLFLGLALALTCCQDEKMVESVSPQDNVSSAITDKHSELKLSFAKALYGALAQDESFRQLLKDEALKMFDNDYDVLYHVVKSRQLAGGITVRDLILEHFDDASQLSAIEEEMPTLTIFVPELPEGSFNARVWDVVTQTPAVAFNVKDRNDVMIVDGTDHLFILEQSAIPAFPVLVVKENERVISTRKGGQLSSRNREENNFRSQDGLTFRFLDDSFNRSLSDNTSARTVYDYEIDPKLIEAYNIYNVADGWHRDYIYYNIAPSTPSGPFSYDFQEHLTSFELVGTPGYNNGISAYNKISDQTGEPKLGFQNINGYLSVSSGWTDGFFEFKVKVLLNARNGVGSELVTYFSASPESIFRISRTKPSGQNFYVNQLRAKPMDLSKPLFNWDLNQYASSIKIDIEEVDRTETVTTTDSRVVKFATNFGIEATIFKKIGLKFGASLEETRTASVQKSYTLGNDELGSVIINFADNVVTGRSSPTSNIYYTRKYQGGWFEISMEPKRVQ